MFELEKRKQEPLYIEIGFYVTSPWEAQNLLIALTSLGGYGLQMSPRLPVVNEMLNDKEVFH